MRTSQKKINFVYFASLLLANIRLICVFLMIVINMLKCTIWCIGTILVEGSSKEFPLMTIHLNF